MTTKTIVITGANSGMGFETALALAAQGHQLVLLCRDVDKARSTAEAIQQRVADARIDGRAADLADLTQLIACARAIAADYPVIDLLICNAGVMTPPYQRTVDGFELQFQVNYLSHFALFQCCCDSLRRSEQAAVIHISSLSSERGQASDLAAFERVARVEAASYVAIDCYRESKLAQCVFNAEIHRRYYDESAGRGIKSFAVHPGVVNTPLFYRGKSSLYKWLLLPLVGLGYALGKFKTPRQGAATALYLAQHYIELPSGLYWADSKQRDHNPIADDVSLGAALWQWSLQQLVI